MIENAHSLGPSLDLCQLIRACIVANQFNCVLAVDFNKRNHNSRGLHDSRAIAYEKKTHVVSDLPGDGLLLNIENERIWSGRAACDEQLRIVDWAKDGTQSGRDFLTQVN